MMKDVDRLQCDRVMEWLILHKMKLLSAGHQLSLNEVWVVSHRRRSCDMILGFGLRWASPRFSQDPAKHCRDGHRLMISGTQGRFLDSGELLVMMMPKALLLQTTDTKWWRRNNYGQQVSPVAGSNMLLHHHHQRRQQQHRDLDERQQ